MKISKIQINNYRLLKDFSLDLEEELSLIIGKNNCGKTSLLLVLNKFLNNGKFNSEDFNLDYKTEFSKFFIEDLPSEAEYIENGIFLRLFIDYDETDDLSNIHDLMMDLDEDNNQIILSFEYTIKYEKLFKMKQDFDDFSNFEGNNQEKFIYFFRNEFNKYFDKYEKSILLDDKEDIKEFIDLKKENISLKNVINYKFISAKREVSNKDIDKTLSSQTSIIYEKSEATTEQKEAISEFKQKLLETDKVLNENYKIIFKKVIDKVKEFGGIKNGESNISVNSTLQHRELLKGNTTVMYSHEEHSLPEHYNGLGYMNLISMIFEIEERVIEFKRTIDEKPADINLLFIEEPEAHTHPQMQYIFIKNIKKLLGSGIIREDNNNRKLQYIITTHSSHIVSESSFDDIKYLKKINNQNNVISKNLKDLEQEYKTSGEEQNYRFLKQYLTLNRAELFFADKSILIEGDTERILIPEMMKKIDSKSSEAEEKLLSQNISIVEVGAYSQVFEKFIDFIGIKTLIITDIDSGKEVEEDGKKTVQACKISESDASKTTNASLKYFFGSSELDEYINRKQDNKILSKNITTKEWELNKEGFLFITYQTKEKDSDDVEYHGRSFEDSFFHINKNFMKNDSNIFKSLTNKWLKKFESDEIDCYEFAEKGVTKKPALAIEILMNSNRKPVDGNDCVKWDIPFYIKEGLIWLRNN